MPSRCKVLNYLDHFLVFVSIIMNYVTTSVWASLVGVPVGTAGFTAGLRIFSFTSGIKKYKSTIKKKRKKHDHVVLLAKTKLSTIQVLI